MFHLLGISLLHEYLADPMYRSVGSVIVDSSVLQMKPIFVFFLCHSIISVQYFLKSLCVQTTFLPQFMF